MKELWFCMRESGVPEKNVGLVQDMYQTCTTVVRCAVEVAEGFKVEVGLHQGSVLSTYHLFCYGDGQSEGLLYKRVVRSGMFFVLETVALTI